MEIPDQPGMYIVTLNNYRPISVNAHDPRIADKAIQVTRANCKVGKAKSLVGRARNYSRTFGVDETNFYPVAITQDLELVERDVLARLDDYRMRGRTGRKNEWLHSLNPQEVLQALLMALESTGVAYRLLDPGLQTVTKSI